MTAHARQMRSPAQPPRADDRDGPAAKTLTVDEVRALIGASSTRSSAGVRNRALIAVLYRGGLRVGEALALGRRDLDLRDGTIRVRGRANRTRFVRVDNTTLRLVGRWIDLRVKLGLSEVDPLFSTLTGDPLHAAYVRELLPRLAGKAGITKRVNAEMLRQTHAVELINEGLPITAIQAQLGHANLATTERLLRQVSRLAVGETLSPREWSL